MQSTTVLSDSPSIQFMRQDEGRGRRGGSGFSSIFSVLSLFSFFLSFSPNRQASAKGTDRQTDREFHLSSPRLASVVEQPCLPKTPLFSGFGLFPFFLSPLFFFSLSPSINLSIKQPRASKQVVHHHHIKWASNPPKPNSSSPRKLCANAIRISAGAIDLFIEVVDLCMLNEEVRIPISPFPIPEHQSSPKKRQKKSQKKKNKRLTRPPPSNFPNIPYRRRSRTLSRSRRHDVAIHDDGWFWARTSTSTTTTGTNNAVERPSSVDGERL